MAGAIFMIIYEKSEKIEPIGDLKQLFLELKRKNYKIGLATSDTLPATMLIMEYLGLTEMFDFIATGDRYLPKPDADMLQAFCQSCQLKATEVIMVGDSLVDVLWERVMAKQELVF